ncbi:hypothetical protein AQUCO_01400726v1 [Aquilegia coerulea]|uniref:Longin domain-containing protein n=1 Tax=Aquilegia coerulea TaxID=218851 RepID=A0A2G5DXT7_AQUCA|nr:hypothetical protein AQUCO_01400726v1 [Aquilegia coerulea]
MVKLTIVGRVSDGLPLAQGPRYLNDDYENMLFYKQQGEIILKEISKGALPLPKMCIRIDHHCFSYLVENGICCITLCELSYPRKLAFHYLQDLHREMEMVDSNLIQMINKPYSFIKIDTVIGRVRKQYVDTRSQANLSRLNAHPRHIKDVVTEDISTIMENRRKSGNLVFPDFTYQILLR